MAESEPLATPATTKIDGREYTVTKTESGTKYPKVRAALLANGWDGETYLLEGKRGAQYIGQRSARDGSFTIVVNLR